MKENISWFLAAVIYIAIIFVLVRPHSTGAAVVGAILGAFADLVRGTAGQTYDPSTKSWSTGSSS